MKIVAKFYKNKPFHEGIELLHELNCKCTGEQFERIRAIYFSSKIYCKAISYCWFLPDNYFENKLNDSLIK